MRLGELLSSAGRIGAGWREEEDLQRRSQQLAMQTAEMRRDDAARRELAGLQMPSFEQASAPQFSQPFVPGQGMPMVDAPAAPAPAPAPAPGWTSGYDLPMGQAAGLRTAPAASAPTAQTPAAPLTPDQARQARNLVSLQQGVSTLPAAALDVVQAPMAGALNVVGGLAAQGANFAGRGLNYTFGTNLPTDFRGPQFSLTPFYDQLVRQPEQQLQPRRPGYTDAQGRSLVDQIPGPNPATAAAAAAAAPTVSEAAQKRLTALTNAAPQALQSPGAQQVLARAQALGVDPVAAATIYGIETSYGANTGSSPRGARGPMQVTDATFAAMKRWYTDPKNITQYNIPEALVQVARSMARGNPQGEVDAGLLRLKYNELIGLPQNLWGAGYQTNAEKVLKAGAPLSISDGGLSNGDYNSIYVSLYPVIAQSMSGAPAAPAAPAAPGPVATGTIRRPAAPAAPANPLTVPRTQAENMSMADKLLARPETIPFELRQLQEFAEQQAALLTRQRNDAARLAQVYMRSGTTQGIAAAERLRATIDQADAGLLTLQQGVAQKQMYLQGMQGLREFATAQDPRRLAGVLSTYMGVPVGIQPRSDGRYNYFINGERVREGLTAEQVSETAMREFSPEARQAVSASARLANELALKLRFDPGIQTAQINAIAKLFEARTKGEYDLQVEALKKQGIEIKPDAATGRWAIIRNGRELLVVDPREVRQQETPFGVLPIAPPARRIGLDVGQ